MAHELDRRADGTAAMFSCSRHLGIAKARCSGTHRPSTRHYGPLRGGRDVWMLVRFNIDSRIVRAVFADELIPFGLVANNHAGQRKVIVQETPIRVVCANTLGLALNTRKRAQRAAHRVGRGENGGGGQTALDRSGRAIRGRRAPVRAAEGAAPALRE